MEEILASIRRIISDEPQPGATAEVAPAADGVLDLTPAMRTDVPPPTPAAAPTSNVVDPVADFTPEPAPMAYVPPEPEPEPEPVAPPYTPPPEPRYNIPETPAMTNDSDLMSPQTAAAAAAALAGLSSLTSQSRFEGQTVEALVREMLRPMLRQWMDANLPTLVERLVETEIERLARRGR